MDSTPDPKGRRDTYMTRARTPQHKFHRAYKACIKCRTRKTRCEISAEEYSAGLPCARCRREMATCTFPTERHATSPKQRQRQASRQENRTSTTNVAADGDGNDEETAHSLEVEKRPPCQPYISPYTSRQSGGSLTGESGDTHDATERSNDHVFPNNISDTMMRTVVSNGEDALNLLFEAARHDRNDAAAANHNQRAGSNEHGEDASELSPMQDALAGIAASTSPAHSTLYGAHVNSYAMSTNLSDDLLSTWKAYRFVRMGWFSPEEAITYVDLFFRNMAHLSPILDDFYSHHSNHYWLVFREPMLCCMILTISSRYHALPVSGGESRGFLIHQRLWDHCQHLLMRILLGQEKGSKAKTRTMGSIEALLLLTDWQPRGLHAPPAADGWDSDIMFTIRDERDDDKPLVDSPSRGRWLEDVINPARRFDRMASMAMGVSMTLANELGMFNNEDASQTSFPEGLSEYEKRLQSRRVPLATILHTYQEQLSSRLGRKSMVPRSVVHGITFANLSKDFPGSIGDAWQSSMGAWTELTKLTRSITDMLFPSSIITKHLIQSGRYISMIDHFTTLLSAWEAKYLHTSDSNSRVSDILAVDYQHTKIHANSLGLQAIVERTLADVGLNQSQSSLDLSSTDYGFVSTVVDGCLDILNIAIKMHERHYLRFAPVSVFLRITTASVFLLKGLGLGVNVTKLSESLSILTRAIAALRDSKPDDLHLGSRYATLLELHVVRLQAKFIPAVPPPRFATRLSSVERQMQTDTSYENHDWGQQFYPRAPGIGSIRVGEEDNGGIDESWLALPFDPSLIPFAPDDFRDFQGLGDNSMDFIWNLAA